MNHAIRKIGIGIIILFALSLIPYLSAEATSGACSWHGGVNCSAGQDWDGSVICNDGWRDSSVSYYSMVKCQGYNNYDYNYPSYPAIPDCPLNSYYDSLSDSCKCYSSYVVSGGKCISADQYCRDLFGFNARHNILTDKCECSYGYMVSGGKCVNADSYCWSNYGYSSSYNSISKTCECDYGYVFDSLDQCVSRDEYCQDLYGYSAEHSYLSNNCKCKSGYVFNSSMTRCIDGDSYCHDNYGYNSDYNSISKTCECDYGYELRNNRCVKQEDEKDESFYIPYFESKTNKITECNDGYLMRNNKCITHTEDCIQNFGVNVYGTKGDSNNSSCYCKEEYEWNSGKTACVKTQKDFTQDASVISIKPQPESASELGGTIEQSQKAIECNVGYTLSFNKKSCVKIPENAHAIDSPTDLWLCDDGHREANNICVLVEDQEEIIDQDEEEKIEEQPREKKKILKFLANALTTVGNLFKNFFKLLIKR